MAPYLVSFADHKAMLIFLAFLISCLQIFLHICFMRNKLFTEKPKTMQTTAGRWLRILPDSGEGCLLYDALEEQECGRILFDAAGNWIYDGDALSVEEQEEVAGAIGGYHLEMENLFRGLESGLFLNKSGYGSTP
jgi:hypothetical protein